jgi:glucose-6-phosphate dehydrogenase assembly protein OpcA
LSAAVRPERILRELAELWVSLGKEQATGVLRACAMTLIVAVDNAADAASASETLAELMHEHPSRAIVLKLEEPARERLDSRVFAQCWMPFGSRQQICCEQIEITFSCDRLVGVTPVILGITVPDLPVVLWSRSARLLELPEFAQLLPLARKVIIDSASLGSPAEALRQVQSLGTQRREVADLAWTRLTRWRQLIANAFEEPGRLERLKEVTGATILHTGSQPPSAAYYLGGWLKNSIGRNWKNSVTFQTSEGSGDCIRGIDLHGQGWNAGFQLTDTTAIVDFDGVPSRVVLSSLSEYMLLREELGILEHEAIFERSLETAVRMAEGKA